MVNIAIPSHKRASFLCEKTLPLIANIYSSDNIAVFIDSKEDYQEYADKVSKYGVKNVVVTGKKGMGATRNFILDYYSVGDKILSIDDDVEKIVIKGKSTSKPEAFNDIAKLVDLGFSLCDKNNTILFGINPVPNPFYMKNNISLNLKFIMGGFYGCIIPENRDVLRVSVDSKEDYERTLKVFSEYKKVIRFNNISWISKTYSLAGGMQAYRTKEDVMKGAKYLCSEYPHLCKINTRSKKETVELILNSRQI